MFDIFAQLNNLEKQAFRFRVLEKLLMPLNLSNRV